MERIVAELSRGAIDRDRAIAETRREGFRFVLDTFPRLRQSDLTGRFYVINGGRLHVTDETIALLSGPDADDLAIEIDARWSLLESDFAIRRRRDQLRLVCDERAFYLTGADGASADQIPAVTRTVTTVAAALHGYQVGRCLHRGEPVSAAVPVAPVLPATEFGGSAWNLVVAHPACSAAASATIPTTGLIEHLSDRNERLIASSNPLSSTITGPLGTAARTRRRNLIDRYESATIAIRRGRQPGGGAVWFGG